MPLLSLPFDILDAICRVVVQDATKVTFCRCTDTEPPGFQQLYKTRRPKEVTPYSTRLVCKDFNDVLTKYLFRDVYIRLGWDWLHINPPLRELASNPNNVFRQNARALRIGPLVKDVNARYFQRDDIDRDDESLLYLPLDIYDVYPDPKTVAQKQENLQKVILEAQTHLANAIASLTNVEEFAWELHEAEYPDWFHDAVTAGLSSLKKIRHVRMCRRNNWRTRDKAPVPFFRDMTKFAKTAMHLLTHIDVNFNERLPPDFDQFWNSLKDARIKLVSLRTNAVSMAALEYVASYSGIEILSYGHRTLAASDSVNEDMAAYIFGTVIGQHLETLQVLELPVILQEGESWSISEENIGAISKCILLRSLSVMFRVWSQNIEQTTDNFAALMKDLTQLSRLNELELNTVRVYDDVDGVDVRNVGIPPTIDIMNGILKGFQFKDLTRTPNMLRIHVDTLSDMPITYNFQSDKKSTRYQPPQIPALESTLGFMACGGFVEGMAIAPECKIKIRSIRAGRPRLTL